MLPSLARLGRRVGSPPSVGRSTEVCLGAGSQGAPDQTRGLRDATMKRNAVLKANADTRAKKLEGIVRPLREAKATLRQIAAALDEASVKTPRGGTWQPASVARLLEGVDA